MTGKSYSKKRVFLSSKFTSPISRKSLEETALDFRRILNGSSTRPMLNANLAAKALPSAQSRTNTDGKKRTNTGAVPGVENFDGYRFNPKQKGEPGKVFKPYVSFASRTNPRLQTPNWGWVDRNDEDTSLEEKKSHIRIRRYEVSRRNGEIIESSEEELNRLTVSGLPLDIEMQEKRLPGQTIGEMMRGGSLVGRAARAIGILTDADGRLRCPPGTPAANQFTDSIGSNCFGFSASEIVGMAQRFAGYIDTIDEIDGLNVPGGRAGLASGAQSPLRNSAKGWAKLIGDKIKTSGQFPWKDLKGRDQQPSEWEVEEIPGAFNWFKNGAKRGRKSLREMHDRTNAIKASLGVGEPTSWDRNSDLIEAFDRLRDIGVVTTQFVGRPQTEEEVKKVCETVLKNSVGKSSWDSMPDSTKELLIREEMKNYFTAERAMLEQVLKSYSEMPSHMRTVDEIKWNNRLRDNSEAQAGWDLSGGAFGGESSFIDICMPQILANARKMLPPLDEYQRARIDALGGGSDAENATELSDFLVSAFAYSKETAALIGGLESFARHIMSHEISHTTQFRAIIEMAKRQINADGSLTLPNGRTVTSWTDISNEEWQELMSTVSKDPQWLVKNLKEMQSVIDRANAAQWLAGKYPAEEYPEGTNPVVRALEITAELAALREQGIIHGEVVDDALAFMDAYVDRRFNEERGISDAEETARFLQLVSDVESGAVQLNTSEGLQRRIDAENAAINRAKRKQLIDSENEYFNSLSEDELVDEIANLEFEYEKIEKLSADNPNDNQAALDAKNARERLLRARQAWRDKTGLDNKVIDRRVKIRRDEMDLLQQEELDDRRKKREIQQVIDDAESSSQEDLITRLAYIKTKLSDKNLSQESREKLEKARKIYRDEYRKKAKDSGNEGTTQKINREIDKLVDEKINPKKPEESPIKAENQEAPKTKAPKPKPVKTPKNKAATKRMADRERQALLDESMPHERLAIVEMSDPSDKDISQIIDPERRNDAIDAIRSRNDALVEVSEEIDQNSTYDGSLQEQLDNVLLPTLDLIERSELQNTVQIETTLDLTDDQFDGSDSDPINVDGFISGRLITGENGISSGELSDTSDEARKKPRRIVIQVEQGQKGYYPNWSDESSKEPAGYKQKLVLPPGEIEIVDRINNPDGSQTLVARVKRQKSVEEILDGILTGEGSSDIPPGARVDIEKSINRHILERRKRGLHSEQKTPSDIKEVIDSRNNGSLDTVNNDGGSFGTGLEADYVDSIDGEVDAPGEVESDVFGPLTPAVIRRRVRAEDLAEINERLKKIFESGEADEELGISPEDIDPEIIRILDDLTPGQVEEALAEEASKVHDEIDKRPRVVLDEEDLEEVIEESNSSGGSKPWWEMSGVDVDPIKPERSPFMGLSSGSNLASTEKIGTVSSLPISTAKAKRKTKTYGSLEDQDTIIPVYEIDGDMVAFGNDSTDDPNVKLIPINPYSITGKSPSSDEGRRYASLWFDATVGQMAEDSSNDGRTSALLYAAARGDNDAQKELERLAEAGKEKMAQVRRENTERLDSFKRTTKEDRDKEWYLLNAPRAVIRVQDPNDKYSIQDERPIDLSQDVYMVHQTSYMPEIDENGDYIIRPSEDHEIIDPETGKRWVDSQTGEIAEVNRSSVHFALNHIVGGHMYRQTPTNKTYMVMIPAQTMIDANPGALDNLYAIDSWMTPKPGEGLRLPKDKVRIVEIPGTSDFGVERPAGNPLIDWTPEQTAAFEDATKKVADESRRIFNETFKEVARSHTENPNYNPVEFPSGMHGSDEDIDLRIRDIADSVGVRSMKHDGSASFGLEKASKYDADNLISTYFRADSWLPIDQLSENAKMRVTNNSRFSTSKIDRSSRRMDDDYLASGRQSRSSQLGRGLSARAARAVVGKVLENSDSVDDETREKILLASEVVASFAAKGPTAALTQLTMEAARRGGREVAEIAIRKMIDSGKITPQQAAIAMRGVDRVAPEGLPDPLRDKLIEGFQVVDEFIEDKVLTDENKERLIRASDEAKERAREITERARESVGDGAQRAKEKTRSVMDRLKNRRDNQRDIPSIDDVIFEAYSSDTSDPFASPTVGPSLDYPPGLAPELSRQPQMPTSVFDDPFESTYDIQKRLDAQIEQSKKPGPRFMRRLKKESDNQNTTQVSDPFEFDPFA